MNRKAIIFIAGIIAVVLGIIPLVTATILSYRYTRNVVVNNLREIVEAVQQNSENILTEINLSLKHASRLNPDCNSQTISALQKLDFLHPQISSFFIANNEGKIVCTSFGKPQHTMTFKNLLPSSRLTMIGPLKIDFINKPILLIFKSAQNNNVYGAMVLPQVFINFLAKPLASHGYIGIMNLVNNHVFSAAGRKITFEKTPNLPGDITSAIKYKVMLDEDPAPITLAVKLSNLNHTYIVAADSDDWIWHDLWLHLSIVIGIGLLLSACIIILVMYLTRKHLSLAKKLERALANNEFEVYYQPVIDLKTNTCVGAEALIRWNHKEDGLIMPDLFIPLAEKNGQIIPITKWLIQQIIVDLTNVLEQDKNFHIAVNLSANFFENDDILQMINHICATTKISPHQFIMEVTERELILEDNEFAISLMQRLRALDISLALDDFGTGYSSHSYLRLFPFNYIKIERQFVAAIGTGAITEHLVDSIIDIAHKLNLKVIAEGLETEDQINYLINKNVTLVQGWYFSKPLPIKDFLKFVTEYSKCL